VQVGPCDRRFMLQRF